MAYSSSSWVFDIQDKIYSRLEAVCLSKLSSKYPDINVTMDDHVPTHPKFPSVYLRFLSPIEIGKDLDGQNVNAIYLTAQIEVTVTSAQKMTVANEVSQVVADCMKDMRFAATLPEFVIRKPRASAGLPYQTVSASRSTTLLFSHGSS